MVVGLPLLPAADLLQLPQVGADQLEDGGAQLHLAVEEPEERVLDVVPRPLEEREAVREGRIEEVEMLQCTLT